MRGEELDQITIGEGGVAGDRLFAFRSSAAREDFPYFTAREQPEMLLYRPRLRGGAPTTVEVQTPRGEMLRIDDPALIDMLRAGSAATHHVTLMRSDNALTDCHPVSVISLQTVRRVAEETGTQPEKRRFRANIYLDLAGARAFAENDFVGRSLRIGPAVVISVLKRDSRCMLITIDPETAAKAPALLKTVAQSHGGTAGIYASVAVEGAVRKGDSVDLLG